MRLSVALPAALLAASVLMPVARAQEPPAAAALLRQAAAVEDHDPARARFLLREASLRLPAGRERNKARARLCLLTAVAEAKSALPIAASGLAASRAIRDSAGESRFLRCEGYAYDSLGDAARAATDYGAAVVAADAANDREALADALAARGELRHFDGEYEGAIADLDRAYALDRAAGLESGERYVLNAMANLYADPNVGEYDKAIGYYRELLARHERAGRRSEVATERFNLGATLESKHAYAQALDQYHRALVLYEALGDAASVAETQRVVGATLVKQGHPAEALPWIDRSLAWFRRAASADDVARVRLTRAIALRAAGRPSRALMDLDASRSHFDAGGNRRFLVRIDEERALAYADLGNWRSAYDALRLQFDAQREIDRALAADRTTQLRVQFDAERTEQLNRSLRSENASRGAALEAAARERRLQGQVIVLGILLVLLLAALAARQLVKGRKLRVLAMTDDLTGLPNRRSIDAFLRDRVRSARRGGATLAGVAIDVDHFTRINDAHGHDAGDRVLARVARRVESVLRSEDRLGRVGGEEFLLVLPGTSAETAVDIAEKAREAVAGSGFDDIAQGLAVTISLGVAALEDGGGDGAGLSKRADAAMYRAKREGRNRVARA
jgi:diguanylate cyclase (GGDEF)-like protein